MAVSFAIGSSEPKINIAASGSSNVAISVSFKLIGFSSAEVSAGTTYEVSIKVQGAPVGEDGMTGTYVDIAGISIPNEIVAASSSPAVTTVAPVTVPRSRLNVASGRSSKGDELSEKIRAVLKFRIHSEAPWPTAGTNTDPVEGEWV